MNIYAVDLDGTLCKEQEKWWGYNKSEPILENIDIINTLHAAGHQIIIYTSRFEKDREGTMQWLKDNSVSYTGIKFDKFRADFYIDENSIRPREVFHENGQIRTNPTL